METPESLPGMARSVKPELLGDSLESSYPFSFLYGGIPSHELLPTWPVTVADASSEHDRANHRRVTRITWASPDGLTVTCDYLEFTDEFTLALDWVITFANSSDKPSGIVSEVRALDVTITSPMRKGTGAPYILHRSNGDTFYINGGGSSGDRGFMPSDIPIAVDSPGILSGTRGFPSVQDMPFSRIDTERGSVMTAIGWTGQWVQKVTTPDNERLRIEAGMGTADSWSTHFRVLPDERPLRTPRILLFAWNAPAGASAGDVRAESNARFRELIYKHYVAPLSVNEGHVEEKPLPTVHMLDVFAGPFNPQDPPGGWEERYTAARQEELIAAYEPLELDAYIQDATWFGRPDGQRGPHIYNDCGNWTVRAIDYPAGIKPIAEQARKAGLPLGYGVWVAPEMAYPTTLMAERTGWLYAPPPEPDGVGVFNYGIANFGIPEVVDHFVDLVTGFMAESPGFRVYRQDNLVDGSASNNLLDIWRNHDSEARQGVSEIRHIMGMYEFWERIATCYPDSFREACAGGGRRIDLESIRHNHIHQKSDNGGGKPEIDQSHFLGLSQFLPNNVVDGWFLCLKGSVISTYEFDSRLASSMVLGWDPTADDFDMPHAQALRARHEAIKDRLIGGWYALLPVVDEHTEDAWVASQYHRSDANKGTVLAYRRAQAPARLPTSLVLRGLTPTSQYRLSSLDDPEWGATRSGEELMTDGFSLTADVAPQSFVVLYDPE